MGTGRAAKGSFPADMGVRILRELYDVISPGVRRCERACWFFLLARCAGNQELLGVWMKAAIVDAERLSEVADVGNTGVTTSNLFGVSVGRQSLVGIEAAHG
jgi:hypothetical protein